MAIAKSQALTPGGVIQLRKGGRPRKADQASITDVIVAAAVQLFGDQGFAATTMEQVAHTAKVGKDTLYRRYASKDELFQAVVASRRALALAQLDLAASKSSSALLNLKAYCREILTINTSPEMVVLRRIVLIELTREAPAASEPDPLEQRLIELVREAQDAGELRPGDTKFLTSQLYFSVVAGPSMDAMWGRRTYASEAARSAYFKQAWQLFLDGAGAQSRRGR